MQLILRISKTMFYLSININNSYLCELAQQRELLSWPVARLWRMESISFAGCLV